MLEENILASIKKMLGLDPDYDAFDVDIVIFINSALQTLEQLGIGPSPAFSVETKEETWGDFFGESTPSSHAKTFVYLTVRLAFDPPGSSFVLTALQSQLEELTWRLNVHRENTTTLGVDSVILRREGVKDEIIRLHERRKRFRSGA